MYTRALLPSGLVGRNRLFSRELQSRHWLFGRFGLRLLSGGSLSGTSREVFGSSILIHTGGVYSDGFDVRLC